MDGGIFEYVGTVGIIAIFSFIILLLDNEGENGERKQDIVRNKLKEKKKDRELKHQLYQFDWNKLEKFVGKQLKKKIDVLYICDKKACGEDCPNPVTCTYTTDPKHAINFKTVTSDDDELLYMVEKDKK